MPGHGFDIAYVQLLSAVEHLAFSDLPMRARVKEAAMFGQRLRRKHLPQEAWPRLHLLLNRLCRGAGCADAMGLTDEEAHRCAKEFVAIFSMVSAQHSGATHH